MQQKTDFGYILGSARGDALHVVQVTGDYYGAFSKSAICGTTPAARWGSHNGWIELSRHETLQQAAAAAGHRLCKRCSQKAARLAAQAAEAEAEALAALKESGQPDQTEAAYLQQAEEQPAETPAAPALPCQCEHSECTHAYLSVPAGKAAAMFIGPICDECVSHMQEYLLQGTEAEAITEQVRSMYRDQREAAEALAAAEAAADPAEPATWAGNSSNWTDSCPACSDGEFHYIRQGSCWTCNYRHQTAIRAAEAAAAEALTEYPSVKRFARAALPEILAELGRQENLSKLTAYPDLFG
jgi:hypothetical protein